VIAVRACWGVLLVLAVSTARADDGFLAPHPDAPWWLSGEVDAFAVGQPGFHSPYAGANSLKSGDHVDGTILATVVGGYAPTSLTAIVVSGQSIAGDSLGGGHGLAAPVEDDYVRNPEAGAVPFLGSAFLDQVIPLSAERDRVARDPLHQLATLPRRRLELRAGELWAPDWFDGAPLGFRNAAIRHDGAWDYPADQRGYSVGAVVEYASALWHVRVAELTMPKTPRGDYDFDVANARSELAEVETRACVLGLPWTFRVGGYIDHANMGSYAIAIAVFELGEDDTPDVTKYRTVGTQRRGAYAGIDAQLPYDVRAFAGASTSDGGVETFGVAEIDNSVRAGAIVRGAAWGRVADEAGIGIASSGLAAIHRSYLQLGGIGPIVGDGTLRYGREDVLETYYSARIVRGVVAGLHASVVDHPAFNASRGPLFVGELRLAVLL
jgi:high affinity Mn2+ porin